MFVSFQVIHKNEDIEILKQIIEKALEKINEKLKEEHEPYDANKDFAALECTYSYNIKNSHNNFMTGVTLHYDNFCQYYYEDYENTINMGFEWGAEHSINIIWNCVNEFVQNLTNESSIVDVIKFFDRNTQFAYWLLSKEIYEIELNLREILSFLLFKNGEYNENLRKTLKNKVCIRKIEKEDILKDNFENEIFSLDFIHYQELFKNYTDIFNSEELSYIDTIRIFRNSIMHSKGFTTVSHSDYCNAKEKLTKFIIDFWHNNLEMNAVNIGNGYERER